MQKINLNLNEKNYQGLPISKVEHYNNTIGDLKGYDCQECLNKGYIMFDENGYDIIKPCKCKKIRDSIRNIKNSGLENLLQSYSFDKYIAKESWQKHIKDLALKFINDTQGNWFFIGGQVGSGKSHICTAIVNELLNQGLESLYMKWRDDSVELKQSINDPEIYSKLVKRYKNVKVLYIDDFLKTELGKQPTSADIMLAFEILNHRYINQDLITIISTEKNVDDLIEIDEAIGSRIYQMSKKYCVQLSKDKEKNMRLRDL